MQYDIVPASETLRSGDCKAIDSEGTDTLGATPTTTYVCLYKAKNSDDGDFGFSVGTATTDLKGNAASSYTHATKVNIDNTAPTVSSAAYYSDADTSTALSGTVKSGNDVYTKVTFNEKVTHTAGNGASARPEINYKVGNGSAVQYDIVANTATLETGDCKPSTAPAASVYVCRYKVGGSDSGTLGFEVDTGTQDEAGNALAAAWTPNTTLTLEPAPLFTTTVADQRYDKGYAITTLTLPAATGGDTGTTLTYTLSPALPSGLTFNATNRTISGTPSADKASTEYTYTVTETDGDSDSLKFKIEVRTKFELVVPKTFRVPEGSSANITVKLSKQPSANVEIELDRYSLQEVSVGPGLGNRIKTLAAADWNTGVTFTLYAAHDSDALAETDWISFLPTGAGLSITDDKEVLVTVVDDDDSTAPTVTAGSSGYYSDAAATTPLTGPVPLGTDIYTKVNFSENLKHDARDGYRELPHISYKIGKASAVRYDILDPAGTLATGDCKPNHATERKVYICLYTTATGDTGNYDFRVGTITEDLAGQRLASGYTHATKLAVDTTAPTLSSATVDEDTLSTLTLTFTEDLNTSKTPPASRFQVHALPTTNVSSVSISGKTVTLTLATPLQKGPTVTVDYTQPASNRLQDVAGNKVASFSGRQVMTDTTAPTLTIRRGDRHYADADLQREYERSLEAFVERVLGGHRGHGRRSVGVRLHAVERQGRA